MSKKVHISRIFSFIGIKILIFSAIFLKFILDLSSVNSVNAQEEQGKNRLIKSKSEISQEDISSSYKWFTWGKYWYQEEKLDKARECLEKSLEIDPYNGQAESLLASVLARLGSALSKLEQENYPAPEKETGLLYQWYLNGIMRYRRGELKLAEEAFERALSYDEKSPSVRAYLYRIKRELMAREKILKEPLKKVDYAKLLEEIEKKGEKSSQDAFYWYQQGRFLLDEMGDLLQALSCAKIAKLYDPKLEGPSFMIEDIEKRLKKKETVNPLAISEFVQAPKTGTLDEKVPIASDTIEIITQAPSSKKPEKLEKIEQVQEKNQAKEDVSKPSYDKKSVAEKAGDKGKTGDISGAFGDKEGIGEKPHDSYQLDFEKARTLVGERMDKARDFVAELEMEKADEELLIAYNIAAQADKTDLRSRLALMLLHRKKGQYDDALGQFLDGLQLFTKYPYQGERAYKEFSGYIDCFTRAIIINAAVNAYNLRNPSKKLDSTLNRQFLPKLVKEKYLKMDEERVVFLDHKGGREKMIVKGLRCPNGGHSYYLDENGNVCCSVHGISPLLLSNIMIREL